jgi:8-oxo-dGTP pyrophosphatase MutT (NUDIX family)
MIFKFCPNCGTENRVTKQNDTDYECNNCQWHFWNNAKGCVAIAFVKDGLVLVSKRGRKTDPSYGKYDLVGGFIEFDENAYDAAIREVREEAGIELTHDDLELMDVYDNHYNDIISTVDIAFLVRNWRWDMPSPRDDSAGFEWKPLSFLYDKNFWQNYTGLDKKITAALAK